MSQAARLKLDSKDTPGPGMYDSTFANQTSTKVKTQSIVFGTSKRDVFGGVGKVEMPGPGNYNVDHIRKNKGPSYKFGGKTEQRVREAPGPGQYDISIQGVKDRTKTVKIGTSKRSELINSKSVQQFPGPGNYGEEINTFGRNAMKISLKGKPKERMGNQMPGPGSYDYSQAYRMTKDKSHSVLIGSGKRSDIIDVKSAL